MNKQNNKQLITSSLVSSFIFKGALPDSIAQITETAMFVQLRKGESLFVEGDKSESVYVLVEGRITFFMHDEHGKRYVLGLIADYAIFGDMEVFTQGLRVSQAEAHEDSTVVAIPREVFIQVVKADAEIAFNIIRFYAQLLQRLSRFSLFRDVEKQLAYILVDFAGRYGKPVRLDLDLARPTEGIEIDVSISQEFLGAMLGIPRQRVNGILQAWKAKAWIRVHYNRITILNERALRQHSRI